MRGMDSQSIDLIYLDPPFNKNQMFIAPMGSAAEGASFKDFWGKDDVKEADIELMQGTYPSLYNYLQAIESIAIKGAKYYLLYMGMRLTEMHRLLKDTGSLYLHCDPTMSHYLKVLLDCIFGKENFKNEIVWGYRTQGVSKRWWPRKHDIIFMYVKSSACKYYPTMEMQYYKKQFRHTQKDEEGNHFVSTYLRDVWDHDETKPTISQSPERTGYPTQKPLALLERIIQASSQEGDVVLDPFCGCATTCVAAENLKREWVGIDVSEIAYNLVKERLNKQQERLGGVMFKEKIILRKDIPLHTDLGKTMKPKDAKQALYGRQSGYCGGCRHHFEARHLEVDHIIAQANGGTDHFENYQLLCSSCNRIKSKRTMGHLLADLKERGFVKRDLNE